MSSPNDAARSALLVAIDVWADARDAFTLAQMDERVRPSEHTRERTARAGAELKRERVLMLEAVDAFAEYCKAGAAAAELELERECRETELEPAPAECQLCEQDAELEPGTFTPHEHAGATVKP